MEDFRSYRIPQEMVKCARRTDLFRFLTTYHADAFRQEGNSLRWKENPSISIRQGYSGFLDFATMEHGNSIDFLTRHLGYSYSNAVRCLAQGEPYVSMGSGKTYISSEYHLPADCDSHHPRDDQVRGISLPARYQGLPERALHYLASRGIPVEVSHRLLREGLLYQSDPHNNLVFLSRNRDFCEIRGTCPGIRFHSCRKVHADRCWGYRTSAHPRVAFICEGAIDAISLSLLMEAWLGTSADAVYCSIAGVSNQKAIDRILSYLPAFLAVDNDSAGSNCRSRNRHIPALVSIHKDWNEDLQMYVKTRDPEYISFPACREIIQTLCPTVQQHV